MDKNQKLKEYEEKLKSFVKFYKDNGFNTSRVEYNIDIYKSEISILREFSVITDSEYQQLISIISEEN